MADPILVSCPKDAFTKVATAVQAGAIFAKDSKAEYFFTYVDTANPAPTDSDILVKMDPSQPLIIQAAAAVDVYIFCKQDAGRVRVDL